MHAITARVVADSTDGKNRLTTFECIVPKTLLAQVNTYGMLRRVSASSRAIPTLSVVEQIVDNPYMPPAYRYRQAGMVPADLMSPADAAEAERIILELRDCTVAAVRKLDGLTMAKEDANRYLEPWMYTVVVITGTEWDNLYAQRLAHDAQDGFQILARAMREAHEASTPISLQKWMSPAAQWHLPYVTEEERRTIDVRLLTLVSARRVGGVSYLKHGATKGLAADVDRGLSFARDKHWSPLEGPCMLGSHPEIWHGPYRGFKPLRKMYAGESGSQHFGTQVDDSTWAIRQGPVLDRLLMEAGGAA